MLAGVGARAGTCRQAFPVSLQVVLSILRDAGYEQTEVMTDADVVLVNTCAIREGVEPGRRSFAAHVDSMQHLSLPLTCKHAARSSPVALKSLGVPC